MAFELNSVPLRDLSIRITKGTTPTRGEGFVPLGVNYIKSEAITPSGSIDSSKFAYIDARTQNALARSQLRAGNVLFSMAGVYLGKTAVVQPEHLPANTNQAVGIISLDEAKADPYFIHYALQSPACRSWVMRSAAQSAQPNFNLKEIGDLPIPDLSLDEQKGIASALKVLDDRIDNLRKTNSTLEAIAKALFESWFVDFEPVRAKAEGREPQGIDAATSTLFPSEFEDSELGPVPKGWCAFSLGDVAQQGRGSINPAMMPEVVFQHYSLPAFDTGWQPIAEPGEAIKSNKTPVPSGAVLVSKLNPRIPRIWFVGNAGENAVCSTEFLVWAPKPGIGSAFVYAVVASGTFNSVMRQLVTGTSSSHQRVQPGQLAGVHAAVASKAAIAAFERVVAPMLAQVEHGRRRAATLATLRDTLLPRLISGKLRLPEAQASVEEVLA